MVDGLSALSSENDALAGSSYLLCFTAGLNGETHGLFGVLTLVPEPSAYAMMFIGLKISGVLIQHRALASVAEKKIYWILEPVAYSYAASKAALPAAQYKQCVST